MADKLNDEQIASELKRFGDTIKVPFKKEKRAIYIKKLNHYYAKENPPVKKGKSANRQNKSNLRPAEFSDDSQDEIETVQNSSRLSPGKNKTSNNSFSKDSPRKSRNKTSDNGATSSGGLRSRNISTARQKRVNAVQQMELYPEEFSDNDTAEESVYEVEEKSIGINTTLNYDDEDDSSDEESLQTNYQTRSNVTNKERQIGGGNISTISPRNFNNHVGFKKPDVPTKASGSEHFISKSILLVLGIFFIILTCGYIYVKKDIFYPREAASSQTDLKTFSFQEGEEVFNYTEDEINKRALPVIRKLHDQLASLKGKYELGELKEDQVKIPRKKLEEQLENKTHMVDLCLRLILAHPEWNIKAYDKYGSELSESSKADEVDELEGLYGDLPLMKRIFLSLYMVLYGLCLLVMCIIAGVLGIYCLRWQNKRKEKAQQKVYEMVEKIIEILKDNYELAERKNDNKNYPPYLAVQHIRDQLIPVAQRRQMQSLWVDAVKFIETNESRIRVETQIIQGEEFTVWRWLQAMPNGHKMWQGQAFGETSQGSVNSLPYGPTPCLKVRNMFDANMEENVDDWHLDIEESILEKCSDNHGILHIFVDRSSKEGCVYIKCSSCEKAYEAYQALHGWWFDGRLVTVKYLRLEHYHDRFPDSRYKKYPMKPLKTEMPSISRPFKSALEMT